MSEQEKIKSRLKCCAGAPFRKRGIFLSIEKSATSLNCELIQLPEEKKLLDQVEKQKNHLLSEARFELDMQEMGSKVRTGLSVNPENSCNLKGWNSTKRISYLIISSEKNWLCTELDRRENTSGNPTRDAAKTVCTTIHRVSVVKFLRIKFWHMVYYFCVGPKQNPKRLPCVGFDSALNCRGVASCQAVITKKLGAPTSLLSPCHALG